MKILKLAVTRSSTLVAPPSNSGSMPPYHWEATAGTNFAEADLYPKKELPGRTMEFTFDLSQTPLIGRRQPSSASISGSTRSSYQQHPIYGSTSTATGSTLTGIFLFLMKSWQ